MDAADTEEVIRVGSPFAIDPSMPIEPLMDVGPIRYTAMGATAASAMVVGFALAAAGWFPVGGAAISALGCVLAIFGMFSPYRITATTLLAIHLALFVTNYVQAIG